MAIMANQVILVNMGFLISGDYGEYDILIIMTKKKNDTNINTKTKTKTNTLK